MRKHLLITINLLLALSHSAKPQTIESINANVAKSIIEIANSKNFVLVDGRSTSMFENEHIQGAINIDAYSENINEKVAILRRYDNIVVYCTTNNRTNIISQALQDIGHTGTILAVSNGIKAWKENGYETVLGNQAQQELQQDEPKGKPIVQVFGNFDLNLTNDAQKQYGFWFGRAHLGYEYQFTEQFTGKIIIDAGRPTTVGQIQVTDPIGNEQDVSNSSKEGSYYTMTLKFALLEWKPNEVVKIQAGGVLQNHYITQENFWGYRYLAPIFQDRYYGIPSGDLGFISYITINKMLGFDIALTNGEGFRFDQDTYGDVKLAGGINFNPSEGLQTRLFSDYTKSNNPTKPAIQQLFSAFVGYKHNELFRIGGEYNYRFNHLNINNHNLFGLSLYGSYRIAEKIELFARYDKLKSNTMNGEANGWNFNSTGAAYITGIHYNPVKGINLSLNYQGWNPENMDLAFQNHLLISFEYKL